MATQFYEQVSHTTLAGTRGCLFSLSTRSRDFVVEPSDPLLGQIESIFMGELNEN